MPIRHLTEDSPMADPLPDGVATISLRRHQRTTLQACLAMERESVQVLDNANNVLRTRIGILGDDVGAGKSFVILSLIYVTKGQPIDPIPMVRSYCMGRITQMCDGRPTASIPVMETNVLVVPHELCSQWAGYAQVFGGGLTVRHVFNARHEHELQRQMFTVSNGGILTRNPISPLEGVDLLIVSSTFYASLEFLGREKRFKRIIFDEAHSIKLSRTASIDAAFLWMVTASVDCLLDSHHRLPCAMRTLLSDIRQRNLRSIGDALVVRNDAAFVRTSMSLDEPINTTVRCYSPQSIRMLHGIANRNIIECLNAGDVQGALQHVNPRNQNTEENIVAVLVQQFMREVHNLDIMLSVLPTLRYTNESDRDARRQQLVKTKTSIESNIADIRARVQSVGVCSICYDDITKKTVVPCCSNAFCFQCICEWVVMRAHKSCPLCKGKLDVDDLLVVDEAGPPSGTLGTGTGEEENVRLDKLQHLERILRERFPSSEAKFLIFSTFDNSFNHITSLLTRMNIAYRFLKGNMATIDSIIERYKTTSEVNVLLVNPRHYGNGLNFENTSDIVMFHRIDLDMERQVIGRALRMGRTCPLHVWRLQYENEWIDT